MRKAAGLGDDQPMQSDRLRRERGAKDDRREALQDFLEICALDQGHIGRRTKLVDDAMHDGAEQYGLIVEAMIERPLRNTRALRDGVDARRSKSAGEEQIGCDVEDAIAELFGIGARRAPTATRC
jgi:hypothetical protein